MSFDRYKILTTKYTKEINAWRWDRLLEGLAEYEPEGADASEKFEGVYLGSVLSLYPSGKIYAPWTTNQTRADVVRDECFFDALEAAAGSHGLFVDFYGDGVFLVRAVDPIPENENCEQNEKLKF